MTSKITLPGSTPSAIAAPDLGDDRLIADRVAGQVDRDALAVDRQPQAGVRDPAVDLTDHAEALGHRQERGGRDDVPVLGEHPHEQLVVGDPAGAKVRDRLAVQHEAILGERGADPLDPGQRARGLAGEEPCLVAAELLGLVQRDLRPGEDVVGCDLLLAGQERDAHADHDRGPDLALAQDGADVAGDDHRLVLVDLGEDHGELVAAEPGDDVGVARPGPQALGHGLEHHVAGGAAVAVVGQLEVVDVEREQRAGAGVARRERELAIQLADQPRPVEDAGQEVVLREMIEGIGHRDKRQRTREQAHRDHRQRIGSTAGTTIRRNYGLVRN